MTTEEMDEDLSQKQRPSKELPPKRNVQTVFPAVKDTPKSGPKDEIKELHDVSEELGQGWFIVDRGRGLEYCYLTDDGRLIPCEDYSAAMFCLGD